MFNYEFAMSCNLATKAPHDSNWLREGVLKRTLKQN